jgi:metal-dependent amidase/aminoacylase/carboxypeptidase family protein
MFDIAKGMESISHCKVDVDYYRGYPAGYNDPELIAGARKAITAELGDDAILELPQPMSFSEDFAYFREMAGTPSAFFMLCAGHEGDRVYPLHDAKCAMKEEAMPYGIRTMVSVALAYLNG